MSEMARKNVWTMATALALLTVLVVYTVSFTVEAGSVGVLKTFGQIVDVKQEPNLYLKAPWPFQSVETVDTRTRLLEVTGTEVLTRDQFNLIAELSVGWRVNDAAAFVSNLRTVEHAERTLLNRAADARERVVKSTALDDIISTRPEQAERFRTFESQLMDALVASLPSDDDQLGVAVDFVRVKRLSFPKNVTQAINNLMVKERERISEEYRAEGENQAKIIKDDAERQRKEILADAEAQAIITRGEGDAEAVRYYQVFAENPELANYIRELDAFKRTLKKNSTVILPSDSVPFRILQSEPPAMKSKDKDVRGPATVVQPH